jgi:hypothetical protein
MADMERAIGGGQCTGDKKLASVSHSAGIRGLSMDHYRMPSHDGCMRRVSSSAPAEQRGS